MVTRKEIFCVLILIPFTFFGCVFGKLTFTDSKEWVPKDFHPKTDILLVEQYPSESLNVAMVDYIRKNYRGQYEVVERKMILSKSGKNADTENYRFAFLWETKDNGTKPVGHFIDRIINKTYPSTTKSNRYQAKNAYKSYIDTIDLFYKK